MLGVMKWLLEKGINESLSERILEHIRFTVLGHSYEVLLFMTNRTLTHSIIYFI